LGKFAPIGQVGRAVGHSIALDLTAPPRKKLTLPPHRRAPRGLISHRASEVLPEQIEWLWPGRIAAGKLTLIGGKPGLGKSLVTVSIASTVTLGAQWPCNEGCSPCGSVVIFSAEDGLADTIVPRLMAAGADRTRVELVTGVSRGEDRRTFDLKADIDLLEQKVRALGDVRLIIIDPISAYMGKAHGHGNVETRNVLEPVAEMADRLRIAVVAITHLNKGGAGNQGVLERFTGSIAFIAAARTGFAIIGDDENEGRVLFLQVKNNIAPAQRGLAFRCLQKIVGDEIVASFVDWENEHVAQSADDALRATETAEGTRGGSAKDQAVQFLQSILAPGVPVLVQDIGRDAVGAGLHEAGKPVAQNKPLRAARSALGVETKKLGMGQGWAWVLPKVPSDREGAHSQDRASSDVEGIFGVYGYDR
jgi:putative DNA primase/helicase